MSGGTTGRAIDFVLLGPSAGWGRTFALDRVRFRSLQISPAYSHLDLYTEDSRHVLSA